MTTDSLTAPPKRSFYTSHRAPLYFLFFSILCQLIGIGILSLVKDSLVHPGALLSLHSLIAFLVARWLKLSLPWQLFNLLLAPGVVLYSLLELPSGVATTALIVTLLLYAPTFWTRVPYFPTSPKMYERILEHIPEHGAVKVLDLGCGMARLLGFLSGKRPEASFVGVEISPLALLLARAWMLLRGRKNVRLEFKNFWNMSLADYDIVYAFLAPGPMPALWEKVQEEMKPGSLFITNTFQVEGSAHQVIQVDDSHQDALYVHRR
jgi:SAM-dependent methyltransferase